MFSSNEEVQKYTNALRGAVHDVTQTTVIVPHLQDEKLVANRMKSLNKKMNNLERLFGYRRPDPSGEKIER